MNDEFDNERSDQTGSLFEAPFGDDETPAAKDSLVAEDNDFDDITAAVEALEEPEPEPEPEAGIAEEPEPELEPAAEVEAPTGAPLFGALFGRKRGVAARVSEPSEPAPATEVAVIAAAAVEPAPVVASAPVPVPAPAPVPVPAPSPGLFGRVFGRKQAEIAQLDAAMGAAVTAEEPLAEAAVAPAAEGAEVATPAAPAAEPVVPFDQQPTSVLPPLEPAAHADPTLAAAAAAAAAAANALGAEAAPATAGITTPVSAAPAGPVLHAGSAVVAVVSRGPLSGQPPLAVAPNVKGLPQEEALEALQEMNVAAEIVLAFSDDVRAGRVISQFPAAQVPFPEASLAVLVVSRGKAPTALPMVSLPNVVGKTEFEAGEAIRKAGLEPYSIEAFDLQVPAGRVLGQVPSVESLAAPKATRRPLWPWVVAASIVLAGAIAFWAWTWVTTTNPAPKLVGQTQESAIARVNDAGLRLASVVTSAYPDVPPGIVAAQIPAAGTELRRSAEVTIVVSSGEALVTLPGVVGRAQADATNELSSVGLTVTVLQSYDNTVVAGTVLGQVPSAGDEVMPGTLVQLNVSRGRPPAAAVAIPAVAGKSQSESESLIKKAKLVTQVYKVYDASVPSGRAIGTLPTAGSRVAKDTTIGLFISLGKPSATSTDTVTVPNVIGQTQLTAMTSVTSGGLAAAVIQQYSDGIPSGTVFNQIPAAGTRVRRGATVGILVSLGPVPTGN